MKSVWRKMLLSTFVLAVMLMTHACAQEAKNIADKRTVTVSSNQNNRSRMLTNDYSRYWMGENGATVTVQSTDNTPLQGVYLNFFGKAPCIQVFETGSDEMIAEFTAGYENAWIPFSRSVSGFYLKARDNETLKISGVYAYTEGELPDSVQLWETMEGYADLMLVSTHPDDELLWFGGMLPTYAGERDMKVIVVYMTGGNTPRRVNELLDGLWTCGVRWYPEIGYLENNLPATLPTARKIWGPDAAPQRITEMIRKYKPLVVAAQDIKGEYGHHQHVITTEAVIDAVQNLSDDAGKYPESAELYGVWRVKKLYIHLYKENQIVLDWSVPLEKFDNKTGLQVARLAYKKHVSQQKDRHSVEIKGQMDSRKFGLYDTQVGLDEEKNDLFEHIDLSRK